MKYFVHVLSSAAIVLTAPLEAASRVTNITNVQACKVMQLEESSVGPVEPVEKGYEPSNANPTDPTTVRINSSKDSSQEPSSGTSILKKVVIGAGVTVAVLTAAAIAAVIWVVSLWNASVRGH